MIPLLDKYENRSDRKGFLTLSGNSFFAKEWLGALFAVFFLASLSPKHTLSQDDRHYNTIQYGLRGIIMNGAMVAGADDNSAIFYNPAALSTSQNEGLDISLFAVSFDINKQKNAYNTQSDLRQFSVELIPGLITFSKRPFKNKQISLAGGSFTRSNYRNSHTEQYVEETPEGIRVNDLFYENSLREFWLSGAIAYQFKRNVALGMSQYMSFRGHRYEHDISYKLFDAAITGRLLFKDSENLDFRQGHTLGMINKIGFTWRSEHFRIGATVTTPLYARVSKSAKVNYDREYFEMDTLSAGTLVFDVKGEEKTPWIMRLGLEVRGEAFIVAASAEYFHPVKSYDLVRAPQNGLVATVNETGGFSLSDSRKRVININLGWEIRLHEKIRYLGGLRTNFNYNEQNSSFDEPRLHWSYFDIYHLTTGFKVNYDRNTFTIGFDYAFSFQDDLPLWADLKGNSIQSAALGRSSVTYNNFTFLFTYNFLLDKLIGVID